MKEVEWFLKGDPRPVQLEALRRSYYGYSLYNGPNAEEDYHFIRKGPAVGWGHFLEMRMGKTPTALNEMALFKFDINYGVIVAPNTYKQAWQNEGETFGFNLPIHVFDSAQCDKTLVKFKKEGGYLSINYEVFQHTHLVEKIFNVLNNVPKFGLVLDESIKIKNNTSPASMAIREMAKDAKFIRLLSGLPYSQGPQDLYPQLRAIRQFSGVNFYAFRNKFCKMGGYKGKSTKGVKNEHLLKEALEKCSFVAKLDVWAKGEKAQFFVDKLDLTPKQKAHYNEMEADFVTFLDSGEPVSAAHVMTKMMKQQQIASGFMYDEYSEIHPIEEPKNLPKLQRVIDIVENSPKTVIFYHYNASADMLVEALKAYDPCVIRSKQRMLADGQDVEEEKHKFNNDPKHRVMIAQLDRTKYGHDLSGNKEDVVCSLTVYYENTYSLDTRSQTEMRTITAHQPVAPRYIDFMSCPTDASFIKALVAKTGMTEAVLGHYGKDRGGALAWEDEPEPSGHEE
jgi:hypothetical protein